MKPSISPRFHASACERSRETNDISGSVSCGAAGTSFFHAVTPASCGEGRLARGGTFTGPDGNSRTAKPRISSATTYLAAFIQPLLPLRNRPRPENRESEMKGQVFWAAGPIPQDYGAFEVVRPIYCRRSPPLPD